MEENRNVRIDMYKIKSIEKKFCLFVCIVFLILSLVTHISCFTFGFMSGIGLAGWMLLPDKNKESELNR